MKLFNKYLLLALSVLAVAQGCEKEPTGHKDTGAPIMLSASEVSTKALLDNGSFNKNGNRITIYDYVDGEKYFKDQIGPEVTGNTYGYDGVWPFVGGPHQWTAGTHKFFGWLAKDNNMTASNTPEDFFGIGNNGFKFDETNQILSIPSKEMTAATTQFDFLYSNIITTAPRPEPVNLQFKHLFTAVSFGVENSTSSFVKLEEFKIEGIPSTRSATINFKGTETQVNYTDPTATFTRGLDAGKYPYEISPKALRSNIFNGEPTQEFMMLWPVEAEQLHSTDEITTTDEGEVLYPTTWKMYIKYTADGVEYAKRMNFPKNVSWEPGKKYHYNIVFADKMVELRVKVSPWEYEDQDINYTNDIPSISSGGALTWNGTVSNVDETNKMVSIYNAQPAQAMFTLQAPIGGSWIVSLVGDVNAFEVSPATGIIDNQTATIYIKPLIDSPARDYKVQLKFSVRRSDGRMIAADDIIQAKGIYTVVLPRNN